jgi:hypothetical protein
MSNARRCFLGRDRDRSAQFIGAVPVQVEWDCRGCGSDPHQLLVLKITLRHAASDAPVSVRFYNRSPLGGCEVECRAGRIL